MHPELEEITKQKWYTQGMAGRPLFLTAAGTIKFMHKDLGFSFEKIIELYKEDYCDFNYSEKDMKLQSELILKKLEENSNYLKKIRGMWDKRFEKLEKFLQTIRPSQEMPEEQLFDLLLQTKEALSQSVGGSHLIESMSFKLEDGLRHSLKKKTRGKELNQDFSVLTSPVTRSFVSKKEDLLWVIKNAKEEDKQVLADEFISRFFWIDCNYVGCRPLKKEEILEEASKLETHWKPDLNKLKEEKKVLFKKYGFSEKEKELVAITELLIDWQDVRKELIFRSVYTMNKVVEEISKKFKIEPKLLHYFMAEELPQRIREKTVEEEAKKRMKGCVIVMSLEGEKVFGEKDFKELQKAMEEEHEEIEILIGQAASLGTAAGTVKICTTMESLEKVKEGDILVASMTRPEFVPAMKKAAAIVTDEGGVLCHAAIISRELGIPCVIGTKLATKVLKDGDVVEVRASHGRVKILR